MRDEYKDKHRASDQAADLETADLETRTVDTLQTLPNEAPPQFRSFFEQVIEKYLPTPIDDIPQAMATRLEQYLLSAAEEKPLTLQDAKLQFDSWYFPRLLKQSYGNLSKAGEIAGVDRRTLYRHLAEYKTDDRFDPDLYRPTKEKRMLQDAVLRESCRPREYFRAEIVDTVLSSSLHSFKEIIHPALYSKLERTINDNAASITKELNSQSYGIGRVEQVRFMLGSIPSLNYDQAHAAFEKKFVYATLTEASFDVKKAAKYLDISEKTLQRKLEKHAIDLEANPAKQQHFLTQQHVLKREKIDAEKGANPTTQTTAHADSERLRDLMIEYQGRFDERQRKMSKRKPRQIRRKELIPRAA